MDTVHKLPLAQMSPSKHPFERSPSFMPQVVAPVGGIPPFTTHPGLPVVAEPQILPASLA